MFGSRRYRRRISDSFTAGENALMALTHGPELDLRTAQLLGIVVANQAEVMVEFLSDHRSDESLRPLVDAVTDTDAAQRVVRIATWVEVLNVRSSVLGPRYPGCVEAAIDTFGIENSWEHRLVYFEPTAVPEAQGFQF